MISTDGDTPTGEYVALQHRLACELQSDEHIPAARIDIHVQDAIDTGGPDTQ